MKCLLLCWTLWPTKSYYPNHLVVTLQSPKPEKPHQPNLVPMHFTSTWIFWADSIFWPPWTIAHGQKGNFGRFESKQKWAKFLNLNKPHYLACNSFKRKLIPLKEGPNRPSWMNLNLDGVQLLQCSVSIPTWSNKNGYKNEECIIIHEPDLLVLSIVNFSTHVSCR